MTRHMREVLHTYLQYYDVLYGFRYITIPKIMILGIVVPDKNGLLMEPSFFISLEITRLQLYQAV